MDDDAFHAIAQSIADQPVAKPEKVKTLAPSIGLARVNPEGRLSAPPNGLRYSPELFVDILINNPDYSPKQLGEIFGKPQSWVAQVLASANFQAALAPRRAELSNPEYAMTLEERFRGLTIRSLTVLQEKMEAGKAVPDFVVIKIAELGIKALGMGQKEAADKSIEKSPAINSSERVAEKLRAAREKMKAEVAANTIDVESREITNG